jgi:hypothetical protein
MCELLATLIVLYLGLTLVGWVGAWILVLLIHLGHIFWVDLPHTIRRAYRLQVQALSLKQPRR